MRVNQKMNGSKFALTVFTSVLSFAALVGCGSGKAKNGSLVLDSTSTTVSTNPTSNNFTLNATLAFPAPTYMHNASSADWSGPCQVPAASLQYPPVAGGFISCLLEVSEFDLFLSSMNLLYSAPTGACDYVEIAPYVAWQYEPNIGATSFVQHVAANGNVTLTGIVPGNSALPAGTGAKVVANTPVCQYDYSKDTPAGPNCCPGSYAATIITTDSTGGVTTSAASGTWGGKVGNCAVGPGVDFATTLTLGTDPDNMPRILDIAAGTGYAGSVAVPSPLTKGFGSVVYNTNYYPSLSSAPGGLVNPAYPSSGTGARYPRPYYLFTCNTHGREAKGRIALQIRKWNLASELAKGSAGNWNTSGSESDPQFPGNPNNDFNGWQDYSVGAFPGASF